MDDRTALLYVDGTRREEPAAEGTKHNARFGANVCVPKRSLRFRTVRNSTRCGFAPICFLTAKKNAIVITTPTVSQKAWVCFYGRAMLVGFVPGGVEAWAWWLAKLLVGVRIGIEIGMEVVACCCQHAGPASQDETPTLK